MVRYFIIILVICCQEGVAFSQFSDIPKPHKFVGHKIGEDKRLFGWQVIYDYLRIIDEKSDRVILEELGKSTLGKPFLFLKISSPPNLKNIAKYKNLQKQAAYPQNLTEQDVAQLTREKKAIVMVVFNSSIHGVASVQGVLEFVYRLATNQSRSMKNILDNIILLLVPDLNPDGLQKIVEWYNNYLETPHEGSPLPGLTHEYAGDEIHEDWFGLNLVETQMVASQVYKKWYPEVVISINEAQQHPRILIEASATGYDAGLEKSLSELQGIALNFTDEKKAPSAFFKAADLHNQIFFNISAANTLYGTPLFYPVGSAATQDITSPISVPWPGGWWTMRNIIDSEIATVLSVLDWASSNKENIIENFCVKNIKFTKKQKEGISTYFISQQQHDPSTFNSMLILLKQNGVKIYHPGRQIRFGNLTVAPEDYIVPRAQPTRRFIDYMLEKSSESFDLPARYGVEVVALKGALDDDLIELKYIKKEQAISDISQKGCYLISAKSNDAYAVINRLLNRKKRIYQFREQMKIGGNIFLPGTIYIPKDEIKTDEFQSVIEDLTVDVQKINFDFRSQKAFSLHRPKIGIYHPWVTNPDAGWTRLVLDRFGFLYEMLHGSKIRSGGINHYDVIILPDMKADRLISGFRNEPVSDYFTPSMPRPYLDGITPSGVENLKKYVAEGGTLIALGQACRFAGKELQLPVKEFSLKPQTRNARLDQIISIRINNRNPIAFGMQNQTKAVFTGDFYLQPLPWQRKTEVVAYLANPVKASNGHANSYLRKLPVVLNIPMGKGKVILMSIRPQFLGQAPATYKLLFNSILNANSEKVVL